MQVARRVSLCQICGQLAHGNHFGVISCRACAAFFRRAGSKTETFCGLGNCVIQKDGKFYCKKCRLRKCLEAGMDRDKFQHNRDLISTSSSESSESGSPTKPRTTKVPESMSTFLGRPAFILSCEPERASRVKTVIDVTFLVNQATDILTRGDSKNFLARNCLEKMTLKFRDMEKQKSKLKVMKVLGLKENMHIWEQDFLATATWLTHFDEYQKLPLNIKMKILKVVWILWGRLDKLAKTADERRKRNLGNNFFMIGDEVFLEIQEFEVDVSWCTNYSKEQLAYYLDCHHDQGFNLIVDLLIDLNPSKIELNFMLVELCLHYAGKRHQGEVLKFTDQLLDVVSNDLHEHYRSERNSNYSGRLARMMKINNMIRRDLYERMERQEVAKVFNIISVHFSHPDMFCDAGY